LKGLIQSKTSDIKYLAAFITNRGKCVSAHQRKTTFLLDKLKVLRFSALSMDSCSNWKLCVGAKMRRSRRVPLNIHTADYSIIDALIVYLSLFLASA
jgi:hypothetical protein